MKIVNLEQNSPDWLEWRKSGIGASDACVLAGDGFGDDWVGLHENKTGLSHVEYNSRMARGHRLEPMVREWYEGFTNIKMEPVCCIHDEYPWMRASLDGYNEHYNLILEIKCPSNNAHDKALAGNPPHYYKAQLQHQMMVVGAGMVHYVSYSDDPKYRPDQRFKLCIVREEPEYQEWLLQREKRFFKELEEIQLIQEEMMTWSDARLGL